MARWSLHTAAGVAALMAFVDNPVSAQVTFQWATVGNPGNAPDTTGFGSVANYYRIAKYEVTNNQYTKFLNAVAATDTNALYSFAMSSDPRGGITQSGSSGSLTYAVKANMGNKPVNYVSFFDAMRFVNWLHNGQPTGAQDASSTEDGVYAISSGLSETRAVGARFFVPSENEWYKAAYHQPAADGGDADDYWSYPTASNTNPTIATADATGNISNPGPNVANYFFGSSWNGLTNGNVTTVGSAGTNSESFYGTADQGGNVWEWNEAVISGLGGPQRGIRGGSISDDQARLHATFRHKSAPTREVFGIGFRVASPASGAATPTVSQWGLAALVLLILTAGTVVLGKTTPRPT